MKLSKFDAVGVNVKVLLDVDGEWHDGMVEEYNPRKGYHIQLFDGEDIWLQSLDDRVQFEEEYHTGEVEVDEVLGKTLSTQMSTQMSFHDDELAFLQDAEDVLQADEFEDFRETAHREDIPQREEDEEEMLVPDFHSHQQYNQRSITADLPTLPPRGVLLTGSVLGAAGLLLENEDTEGELFFKVLFVEGGSQPAMFRCKTPIYTSAAIASSLSNPVWNGARFQFDMIMPVDAAQDKKSPYGFRIQGEIIIAVYMSRSSGGNSLLGQASFQLKDLVETGTVEFFASGVEGRSVTGAHTILSRAGDISGEVDVQLNIAWRSLNAGRTSLTASQSRLAGIPPRPASAGASRTGAASGSQAASKAKPDSNGARSATPKRPASAVNKGTIAPPRKIVSNIQRKQREDAARIAKENLKLQHTLQQHANRNGRPSAAPSTTAYAAGGAASTAPSSAAAATKAYGSTQGDKRLSMAADAKETTDSRDYKAAGRAAASAKASSDAQTIEALLRMYMDLKRSAALDEQENTRLKLKLGKLKVSVKQCEMSVDRIRSEAGDTQSKGVPGLRSSMRSSGESNLRSREGLLDADPKSATLSRLQAKDVTVPAERVVANTTRVGAHEYVPFFAPMTEAERRSQGIHDGEYQSLAEEYTVLQSVRRGLLDRIRTAQLSCSTAGEKQVSAQERLEMIRRRVDYYRDIARKLAIGINLRVQAEGDVSGAKKVAVAADSAHSDYILFDRLREGKQEYVTDNALYEAAMHTTAQENAMEELRAVRDFLASKCTEVEQSVRRYKSENDGFHQRLRTAMRRDGGFDVDAYVQRLREERGRKGKKGYMNAAAEERLQLANQGIAAVDKELKNVRDRQSERRASSAPSTATL
jgi:hypothetical protein